MSSRDPAVRREVQRQFYLNHPGYRNQYAGRYPERINRYAREHRAGRRQWLDDIKAAAGCADCAERDPVVLDFDHRPGEDKLFSIGAAVSRFKQSTILNEIQKCDVVCSNCHRRRTHRRRHGTA